MPWRGPAYPGEVPTLGWGVLDWITEHLVVPDGPRRGDPLVLTDEQAGLVLRFYAVDDRGRRQFRRAVVSRPKGWGKALALDTPVPTPDGWTTIGRVRPGDAVFDETGKPISVVAVSPTWIGDRCYAVSFSDGERVVANESHLWTVEELAREYRESTVTTGQLRERLLRVADGARNWRLQLPRPLDLPDVDLPVDPYVLGVWLGDGHRKCGRVTNPDVEVWAEIKAAGFGVGPPKEDGITRTVYGLIGLLRRAGLGESKFIPDVYLRSSERQRWALLQGLMDSDGHCDKAGICEFSTSLDVLHCGVVELLASLGVKSNVVEGRARIGETDYGPKWRVKFKTYRGVPFRIARKAERVAERPSSSPRCETRRVVAVDAVASVPTKCIQVDSKSSLFLVGHRMVQTHNSPLLAALCAAEAVGPVQFDGWSADGEPVGAAWPTPWVQIAAVSEDQTDNTYSLLIEMLTEGSAADAYGLDVGQTRTFTGGGGRIEPVTSSSGSREGQRVTFGCLDETHLWTPRNGGERLAATVRRNSAKMSGTTFETTNAFKPGELSVAEKSYDAAQKRSPGLLVDHTEPSRAPSMRNKAELRRALRQVYGDARQWVDLERILEEIEDPATDPDDAKRFYLNLIVAGSDRAFDAKRWHAAGLAGETISDGALVTVGFDGSKFDDATAIVVTDVAEGFQQLAGCWERPENADDEYEVDSVDVDAVMAEVFDRYDVWRAYCDPPYWETQVDEWAGRWGEKRVVRWWTNRRQATAYACRAYATAIRDGSLSHDADPTFAAHIGHAHKRELKARDSDGKPLWLIGKDRPKSPRKIDAAMAGLLSWEARGDSIAAGATKRRRHVTAGF